jgi:hypothetical protein
MVRDVRSQVLLVHERRVHVVEAHLVRGWPHPVLVLEHVLDHVALEGKSRVSETNVANATQASSGKLDTTPTSRLCVLEMNRMIMIIG